MKTLRCLLGFHHFRGWVVHTGPCVFKSEAHVFRRCNHCTKEEHLFATINGGNHAATPQ